MIRVSGLLIEDMRTAVCIRFCVAAKEGGAGWEAGAGEGACRRSETEARRDRSPQTADAGEKRRHGQPNTLVFVYKIVTERGTDGVAASLGEA